ncbi:MAG: restriction endonuclease [Planctomycetota bacterium]|nr:restriction endonuclease [Planctomycetota bacterium]
MPQTKKLDNRIRDAVKLFWQTRTRQDRTQGSHSGHRDQGNRTAATGGKQLDGFVELICQLLRESGIPDPAIFWRGRNDITLPGFFRPTKQWDVIAVAQGNLLASIECKALCGPSFGNNYNNRVEEALGSAIDIWTAFREGAFANSHRPFVGYVLLLEDAEESTRPVTVSEKHFPISREFVDCSYAQRCEESLRRMLRERCYDSAAFILSDRKGGLEGNFWQSAGDLKFERFSSLMCNHVAGAYRTILE